MKNKFKIRGYSLLELSVVLVIISLVTGAGLSLAIAQIAQLQYNVTLTRMEKIEQAMLNYRKATNRLPCPGSLTLTPTDGNYGFEGGAPGVCTPRSLLAYNGSPNWRKGAVPVRSLGLPDDYIYDGWGNRFTYVVVLPMTANNAFDPGTTPINWPSNYNGIAIFQWYASGGTAAVKTTNKASDALYALISHGENGNGSYTRNGSIKTTTRTQNTIEAENCMCNVNTGVLVSSYGELGMIDTFETNQSSGTNYSDDILLYKNRMQLAGPAE